MAMGSQASPQDRGAARPDRPFVSPGQRPGPPSGRSSGGAPTGGPAAARLQEGRHVRAEFQGQPLNAILPEGATLPPDPRVAFAPGKINVYANDWRVAPVGA